MLDSFEAENDDDEHGNPAGGFVKGIGLEINWQNGPLGRGEDRVEPNGAFVETVIKATIQRLEYYQSSRFTCIENAMALAHLQDALNYLQNRTRSRENRKVEGTHQV